MRGFLARVFITAFGLWMADTVLNGISFDGLGALWMSALLLGLVNAFVRPLVFFLTLPVTIVTLGLFVFVVNGAMVMLVAAILPSFHSDGWGSGILAAIVVGLTGWAANALVGDRGTVEVWSVKGRRGS